MRWSISEIIYYSHHGQKRSISFNIRGVTIITGRSNTGKTGIIKTVDYCLGSSKCDIPHFVKKRCTAVAVKFTNGIDEIFIARDISSNSNTDSETMYFHKANFIGIPDEYGDFSGKMKSSVARNMIEQSFGIDNISQEVFKDNKVSIRQATAFMFLSKEVIDSGEILFHHSGDRHINRHIAGAMPYFLGVTTLEDIVADNKIEKLKKEIKKEEKKREAFNDVEMTAQKKGLALLAESKYAGMISNDVDISIENEVIPRLKECCNWKPGKIHENEDGDDKYATLQLQKQNITQRINQLNKEIRAVKNHIKAADGFKDTIEEQHDKMKIISLFSDATHAPACPICASPLGESQNMQLLLEKLLPKLASELHTVQGYIPEVIDYIKCLDMEKEKLKCEQEKVDQELTGIIAEMDSSTILQDANLNAMRIVGRISYFMDDVEQMKRYDSSLLNHLELELGEMESKFGADEKNMRLREVQTKISHYASEFFKELPKGEPCLKGDIYFDAVKPDIYLRDEEEGERIRFKEIGSDENYLSIHLALAFALQKFLSKMKRPIPSVLILDQVSRPYYSNKITPNPNEDGDAEWEEVVFREDEDSTALRRYFDFIFKETQRNEELQVIVLEHAYLQSMKEYVDATKYRWNKKDGEKLIPSEWPMAKQR